MQNNFKNIVRNNLLTVKYSLIFWVIFTFVGVISTPLPNVSFISTISIKPLKINGSEYLPREDIIFKIKSIENEQNKKLGEILNSVYYDKSNLIILSFVSSEYNQSTNTLEKISAIVEKNLNDYADSLLNRQLNDLNSILKNLGNFKPNNAIELEALLSLYKEKAKYEYPLFNKFELDKGGVNTSKISTYQTYVFRIFFFSLLGLIFGYIVKKSLDLLYKSVI